jgi:hypothetical protein
MSKPKRKNKPPTNFPNSPAEVSRAVKRLERDGAPYEIKSAYVAKFNPDGSITDFEPLTVDARQVIDFNRAPSADVQDLIDNLDGQTIDLESVGSIEGRSESSIPFSFFQAEPPDARQRFRPGDKVKTIRPVMGIPVGAAGEVMYLEHPQSGMSSKGRHYYCKFDLTPLKIEFTKIFRAYYEANRRPDDPDMPQYMSFISTNCGALDLGLLEPGANWNPAYKPDYEADQWAGIGRALLDMSPAEFAHYLDEISGDILAEPISSEDRVPGWISPDEDNSPSTRQLNSQIDADSDMENDGGE